MYLMARAINAKIIVEFGTFFRISTLYLAAAAWLTDRLTVNVPASLATKPFNNQTVSERKC